MSIRGSFVLLGMFFVAGELSAAPQTFKGEVTLGTWGAFSPMTYVRDCGNTKAGLACKRQQVSVKQEKSIFTFDSNEIPQARDGSHKATLEKVYLIETSTGGDGWTYYMLQFAPVDEMDVVVYGNGHTRPKYYSVITDSQLKPLRGMRLSQNGTADAWLDNERKKNKKDSMYELTVTEHLFINE